MAKIYEPAEDSYLMSKALSSEIPKLLKKNPGLKILEIGCGSGINLQAALNAGIKKENIFGTDVNSNAIKYCKSLGFNCIKSDLFSDVRSNFNLVIFNPPYLPLDKKEPEQSAISTTGGKFGNETIIKFLKQAWNHLEKNGKIFIITSSLAKGINFKGLGYNSKELFSEKMFFEKLILLEIMKN